MSIECLPVTFYASGEIKDAECFKFSVIAARYRGKWIFCRHAARSTWEIPGGHREPGETPEEAARRELWEETGALEFTLVPVCAYCVQDVGMLYFAEVSRLGELPAGSEIAELTFSYALPEALTYPGIQPALYRRVQGWLNTQTNADERWDVYDENRHLTRRTHRRGDPLAEGDYHLVVQVWMQNSRGEFLITRRAPNKGFGGMWETTGGSALAGDDSLAAALREVKEETGMTLDPARGRCVMQLRRERKRDFLDIWLFRQDFILTDVVLQPGETCEAMYADAGQILALRDSGEFVPFDNLDDLMKKWSAE